MIKNIAILFIVTLFFYSCEFEERDWSNLNDNNINKDVWSPTNLKIEQIDLNKLLITWEDNADGENGFKLDRKLGDDEWELEYFSIDANITGIVDTINITEPPLNFSVSYRLYCYVESRNSNVLNADFSGWGGILFNTNFDGGRGYSVLQTADGGYIVKAYNSSSDARENDVWLIKTDENGNEEWNKTFHNEGNFWNFRGKPGNASIQETTDGGYIIIGYMVTAYGNSNVLLIKTDSNGITLWSQIIVLDNTDFSYQTDYGYSVQQTADGGYIISASNGNYSTDYGYNVLLIKTDNNGNSLWTKTFYGGDNYNQFAGLSAKQSSDGGYIILINNIFSNATNSYDVMLIKTDSEGNIEWDKTYGGTGSEIGSSFLQTDDGGYIITGNLGSNNIWLFKTDSQGNEEWNNNFSEGIGMSNGSSIQKTLDGGYIIAGSANNMPSGGYLNVNAILIKTDSQGNKEWIKTLAGRELGATVSGYYDDTAASIQLTTDGGYIITGFTDSFGSSRNVWLFKTDSYGNTVRFGE